MGKIWLSGPDKTSQKKCCGCAGKTGPCSPCCNCSTSQTSQFPFKVYVSGVYTFSAAAFSQDAQGFSCAGSFFPYDDTYLPVQPQEGATRTIVSLAIKAGETITLNSSYNVSQHYYAKPQVTSQVDFERTIAYPISLDAASRISVSIPCDVVKGVPTPINQVLQITNSPASTTLGAEFADPLIVSDIDPETCAGIDSQTTIDMIKTTLDTVIKRKYRKESNFGNPFWNPFYPGFNSADWETTETTTTEGYDPSDNLASNDIAYPVVLRCTVAIQSLPDPAGYPDNVVLEFTTENQINTYQAYRRIQFAPKSMANSVKIKALKTTCILVQFDGYPASNNSRNFFSTFILPDTFISASASVRTDAAKLAIVAMPCLNQFGDVIPCPT